MKILFYINTIRGGGAARVMTNLSNKMADLNHDVVLVITFASDTDYFVSESVKRVVLCETGKMPGNIITRNINLIKQLQTSINSEKPDVAISFMGEPNFRLLMCRTPGVKKIISIRNDPYKEYRGVRGMINRLLFHRADGIVCQTNDAVKWLPNNLQRKCRVIMNQVNPQFFEVQHISSDYYVATGRLNEQKNYKMLIDAFDSFRKRHPQRKLRIYGEGPLLKELKARVDILEASDNIYFMGITDKMPEVLSHAKAFVLSSLYEGMPNGLLEAMAVGLPCISTDCPCGGPRTIIDDRYNGVLVPVNDMQRLEEALEMVENDNSFASSISIRAKERAHLFLPDVVVNDWLLFITTIANKKDVY